MDFNQENERKQAFIEIIRERKSIRNYDPNFKIPHSEIEEILEIATSAPSSANMQPWRFVVIDTPESKEKLLPSVGFNSKQVDTSSAVIAVFGDLENVEYLDIIYSKTSELGGMSEEVKNKQIELIRPAYKQMTREQKEEAVLIDCGLISMQIMLAAKAFGYDTNPIGGYARESLGEIFGLEKERYIPIMLISIGKAAESGKASYRLPVDTVTKFR